MRWQISVSLVALGIELLGAVVPLWLYGSVLSLELAAILHLAATLMAMVAYIDFPSEAEDASRLGLAVMAWLGMLLLPVIGPFVSLCVLCGRHGAGAWKERLITRVPAPVYYSPHHGTEGSLRVDMIRDHLLGKTASMQDRMKALLAIQHVPARYSAAVLQSVLADEADDVRLLAYGMLDKREKAISSQIEAATARYRDASAAGVKHDVSRAARQLAELYWELVYQNLVQGSMRNFALGQVSKFAREGLRGDLQDGGLWLLSGRAHMLEGKYEYAVKDFKAAVSAGIPRARVAPYAAEILYAGGDHAAVRKILKGVRVGNSLSGVTAYWA